MNIRSKKSTNLEFQVHSLVISTIFESEKTIMVVHPLTSGFAIATGMVKVVSTKHGVAKRTGANERSSTNTEIRREKEIKEYD